MERKIVYQIGYRLCMAKTRTIRATIPRVVIEKEARKAEQSLSEFVQTHRVIYLFDHFKDFVVAIKFAPTSITNDRMVKIEEPRLA